MNGEVFKGKMTEKRFIYKIKNGTMIIIDKKDNVLIRDKYRACDYLNRLNDENEQLKKENGKWKSIAYANSSFNSILLHELDIAKEQGYTVSDPFKKLLGVDVND